MVIYTKLHMQSYIYTKLYIQSFIYTKLYTKVIYTEDNTEI